MRSVRDVIVIGSSAGGIQALGTLLRGIASDFPGVIAIVQHRSPHHADGLANVIADGSPHTVHEPADGERIAFGRVYLAPRDRHLRIAHDTFRLERGPKEHFTRPAIDALFRSAAHAYGSRVLGVLLTGGGHDGAGGLIAIGAAGGGTIVQDPANAYAPGMPRHALACFAPDAVLPIARIAPAIMAAMTGKVASVDPGRNVDA